jgi:predicted nuclease of predicted toxin-antitoxin system
MRRSAAILDACVWGGSGQELAAAHHDVVWAEGWEEDPGDNEILQRAKDEGRILVTLDKDFGEQAVIKRIPHCGILRLVNWRARDQAEVCLLVVGQYAQEFQATATFFSF